MDKDKILDYATETPGNTNRAVLSSMLDGIEGGSELPSVTAIDNGKVLTVVNGDWDKADSASEIINVFIVDDGSTVTCSSNFDDVDYEIRNHQTVIFHVSVAGMGFSYSAMPTTVNYQDGHSAYRADYLWSVINENQVASITAVQAELDSTGAIIHLGAVSFN